MSRWLGDGTLTNQTSRIIVLLESGDLARLQRVRVHNRGVNIQGYARSAGICQSFGGWWLVREDWILGMNLGFYSWAPAALRGRNDPASPVDRPCQVRPVKEAMNVSRKELWAVNGHLTSLLGHCLKLELALQFPLNSSMR